MLAAYNSYVGSGNLNGTAATAFSSLAPFATDNGATYASLNGTSASTAGPVSGDRVICLSCHRAHASGFANMLRFDLESTFITQNGAYANFLNKTTAETQAAYYDRAPTAFATYQRVYCNKCHVKD
jgi:predicted CXXCH cytochrome family protein